MTDFPVPPLDLPPPRPLSVGDKRQDLENSTGADLSEKAGESRADGKYSEAAALQYLAVTKGEHGRYELAHYLAHLGKIDDSFYWLELAAMDDGLLSDRPYKDSCLKNLRRDARWPKVEQFLRACKNYWLRTGKAPITTSNAWFSPPNAQQRTIAIGSIDSLPPILKRTFSDNGEFFHPMPLPFPDDWLSTFRERGQTFDQYVQSRPAKAEAGRSTLYLQPLGRFSPDSSPSLETLRTFTQAFFQLDTKLLPPIDFPESGVMSRINPSTTRKQFRCEDILGILEQRKRPDDAYAFIGITMEDLSSITPLTAETAQEFGAGSWWNFVFGETNPKARIGVYSFARLDPTFYHDERPSNFRILMLRRSCGIIAWEISSILGLDNCIYFHCLKNGTNNLDESDRAPFDLCPLDLRKLHYSIGFDVVKRYEALRDFYNSVGMKDEVAWLDKRIAHLKSAR